MGLEQKPLLLAISTNNDRATGWAFPVGQYLELLQGSGSGWRSATTTLTSSTPSKPCRRLPAHRPTDSGSTGSQPPACNWSRRKTANNPAIRSSSLVPHQTSSMGTARSGQSRSGTG